MPLYAAFYRLEREPFSLSPDPAFLYPSPSHREASAQLAYAVESRRGIAMLTGEVGTGKTTLLRNLLDTVGGSVRAAYVLNPPRTRAELYVMLAAEFALELGLPESWTLTLQRFLLESFKQGVTVVALFDEAQGIPPEVLDEIRLLSNLETAEAKLLQVILAGQPEFDTLIDCNAMRALKQRISLRHRLAPLSLQESMQYISSRLKRAGARELPFDLPACREIHHYSGGIPRLINVLCDASLLAGYVANRRLIGADIVKAAAADSRLRESAPVEHPRSPVIELRLSDIKRQWWRLWTTIVALVAVLLVLSLGALYATHAGRIDGLIGKIGATGDNMRDPALKTVRNQLRLHEVEARQAALRCVAPGNSIL